MAVWSGQDTEQMVHSILRVLKRTVLFDLYTMSSAHEAINGKEEPGTDSLIRQLHGEAPISSERVILKD